MIARSWISQARRWVMAPVVADATVARSSTAVLHLHLVQACPLAWTFTLMGIGAPGHQLGGSLFGGQHMSLAERARLLSQPDLPSMVRERLEEAEQGITVALRWPDGKTATPGHSPEHLLTPEPTVPLLSVGNGHAHAGGSTAVISHIATPVPKKGSITLTVEWRAEDIAPTEHAIDAALLHQAAQRATRLPAFPWEQAV